MSVPDVPEYVFFLIGPGREHRRTLFICALGKLVVAIGTRREAFDNFDIKQAGSVITLKFG